jgi:ribulose 1,5-bisphosphate synthetase/thiazole synthase
MRGLRIYSHHTKFLRHFGTKPKRDNYDAIIVGGGHNGLVAAAYLAKSGLRYVGIDIGIVYLEESTKR